MKDLKEFVRRLQISEGVRYKAYDDYDGQSLYPGMRVRGNATIGCGVLLDESGKSELKKVGVTDIDGIMNGTVDITPEQCEQLTANMVPRYIQYAREALNTGIFDTLSPARQCVLADMSFNLGQNGLSSFITTLSFIDKAQTAKNAGNLPLAHQYFGNAADHLEKSLWYEQVGNRARRDVSMLRYGLYCDPYKDGSDLS